MNDNQWHHVVVVILDNSNAALYLDGVLEEDDTTPSGAWDTDSNANLYIGGRADTGGDFNGSIDEVLIYNRSLSADEIKQLYIKGKAKWEYTGYQGVYSGDSVFSISENE